MDFDKAEFSGEAQQATQACALCQTALPGSYFVVGNATVCPRCAQAVKDGPPPGGGAWRAFKALALGSGAGLLGAIGYGLIITFANVELALVTIAIGWFVGHAVKKGSENRGGTGYQVLAAVLTYVWCMMAYVPVIVQGAMKGDEPMPLVLAILVAPFAALAVPFMGEMGPIGLLILAFGIWQGFKEPRAIPVVVTGPYSLGAPAAAAAPVPVSALASESSGDGSPPLNG
jgi:hypothetical protein